jgi:S-adenosylmethionine:tRNA ribosyltransferase-isomerase
MTKLYRLSDFDYHLPPELIAQAPAPERTGSRLLHVPIGDELHDLQFVDLPNLLRQGDLLVFNDSKVIPARLHAIKPTGGAVEILVERVVNETQGMVMMKASKKPAPGSALHLQRPGFEDREITLVGRDQTHDDRFVVDFQGSVFEVLDQYGELPLPPYISHDPTSQDAARYQTVYAQHPGSVAAPTAGLHFDEAMLTRLNEAGVETARVTLHVGSGTFSPVRFEDLSQHKMHSEWCSLSTETAQKILETRRAGGRVIAVGTTSLRTLESWAKRFSVDNWGQAVAQELAGQWDTDLFITPGYNFRVVDAMVTNFHLPKSTLLMLVSAFAGYERIREAYQHAIDEHYRFFSYGDAMFLERTK